MEDTDTTESDYERDDDEDPTYVPQQVAAMESHLRVASPKSVDRNESSYMGAAKPAINDDPSIQQDPNTEDHNKSTVRPEEPAPMKGFAHEKLAPKPAKKYTAPAEQPKTRKVQGAKGESVEVADMATQAPEEAPEEKDFDHEDVEIEPERGIEKSTSHSAAEPERRVS